MAVSSISGRTDSVDVVVQVAGSHVQGPRIACDDLTWAHLAVSINTVTHHIVFYMNGVEVVTSSGPAVRFADNAIDLRIGRSNYGDQFLGVCDEIRIWNVIRSAAEIAALWNHEAKGNEPGLVALYHFEDARDTVAWNRAVSGGLHGTFSAKGVIALEARPDAFINENEPNDCFAAATPVNYGSSILTAAIAPADTDCYKIWMRSGDVVLVETKAKTAAAKLGLGTDARLKLNLWWHCPVSLELAKGEGDPLTIDPHAVGNGCNYEAEEVMRCLRSGKKESSLLPLTFSLQLIGLMDRIRREIGLVYAADTKE